MHKNSPMQILDMKQRWNHCSKSNIIRNKALLQLHTINICQSKPSDRVISNVENQSPLFCVGKQVHQTSSVFRFLDSKFAIMKNLEHNQTLSTENNWIWSFSCRFGPSYRWNLLNVKPLRSYFQLNINQIKSVYCRFWFSFHLAFHQLSLQRYLDALQWTFISLITDISLLAYKCFDWRKLLMLLGELK